MGRNHRGDRKSDYRAIERWDNEGGNFLMSLPQQVQTQTKWLRALDVHWRNHSAIRETQPTVDIPERTRAQKPLQVHSLPPRTRRTI